MTRHILLGGAMALLLASVQSAHGQPYTITVTPAIGPNQGTNGSTAAAFEANQVSGLFTGGAVGTPGTPSYYAPAQSPIGPVGLLATSNNPSAPNYVATGSWLGQPATGNYAGQNGNNIYFGISITGNTPSTTFTTSGVLTDYNTAPPSSQSPATVTGGLNTDAQQGYPPGTNANAIGNIINDPTNTTGGLGTLLNYLGSNSVDVGALNGSEPFLGYTTLGNPNEQFTGTITPSTLLTGLYYSGDAPFGILESGTLAQQVQELLSGFPAGDPNSPIYFGTAFGTPGSLNGNGQLNFSGEIAQTPEPGSVAILAVGVLGLLGYSYNRRRKAAPLANAC